MEIKGALGPLALSLVGILVATESLGVGENSAAELAAKLSIVVGINSSVSAATDAVRCLRGIVVVFDQWEAKKL